VPTEEKEFKPEGDQDFKILKVHYPSPDQLELHENFQNAE
jgi:hypothetical protein